MKSDLERLMQKHNLEAILVTGSGQHNPAMVYLTGGAPIMAELIKRRGSDPVLFHFPIERDEAAKTGLQIRSLGGYDLKPLLSETGGDFTKAHALRYKRILQDMGINSGRVALYGQVEAGSSFAVLTALQQIMPEISLVGENNDSMLMQARFTKDADEIERIRKMGQITCQVVAQTAEFLTSQRVENQVLVQKNGKPVTIAMVKNRINLWLAEYGAENPLGTIFAIGRDAGIPHSVGNPEDWLQLGKPIVFDIYPCEEGGGYFYDCTRTWSLGYAPDELQALYADVLQVFQQVRAAYQSGEPCPSYQKMACELFKSLGHATIENDPNLQEGYVHVLGHGVGLNIHERPWFGYSASADDRITPGIVFTLEPGLYYPQKGMGVRLEDTLWVTPDGRVENLVDYPHDLILPMKR
jgi:Xaa-Pro aminopeptidase